MKVLFAGQVLAFAMLMFLGPNSQVLGKCGSDLIYTTGSKEDMLFHASHDAEASRLLRRTLPKKVEHIDENFSNLKFRISAIIVKGEKPEDWMKFVMLTFINTLPERKYKWTHKISLYVDGKKTDLGDTDRQIDVSDREILVLGISFEQLKGLAAAKSIEGGILLGTDFQLGEEELCAIKAMKSFLEKKYSLK